MTIRNHYAENTNETNEAECAENTNETECAENSHKYMHDHTKPVHTNMKPTPKHTHLCKGTGMHACTRAHMHACMHARTQTHAREHGLYITVSPLLNTCTITHARIEEMRCNALLSNALLSNGQHSLFFSLHT